MNETTLAYSLLFLNKLPLSTARMSSTVLEHYITYDTLKYLSDKNLNARLLALG